MPEFKPGSVHRAAVRSWAGHLVTLIFMLLQCFLSEDSVRNTYEASTLLLVLSEHSRNSTATVCTIVITINTIAAIPYSMLPY